MEIGEYTINAIAALNTEIKDVHRIKFPEESIHINELTEERAARDYFNYAGPDSVDDAILRLNEIEMKRGKKQCVTFSAQQVTV